jgi:hypothetical protein
MASTRIKPGLGKRVVDGKSFRLASEVRYFSVAQPRQCIQPQR